MKKLPCRFLALFLVSCLAVPPQSGAMLNSPYCHFKGAARNVLFQQEALVPPDINWLHSFTSKTREIWSAAGSVLASFFKPQIMVELAGFGSSFQVPVPDAPQSGTSTTTRLIPIEIFDSKLYQQEFFKHVDGVDFITTAAAVHELGIHQLLRRKRVVTTGDILRELHGKGNRGYWEVAMRLLADQGWVKRRRQFILIGPWQFRLTELGRRMTQESYLQAYSEASSFIVSHLSSVQQLEEFFSADSPRGPPNDEAFVDLMSRVEREWDLPAASDQIEQELRQHVLLQLEAPLLCMSAFTFYEGRAIKLIAEGNGVSMPDIAEVLQKWKRGPIREKRVKAALQLFVRLGWMTEKEGRYYMTVKGKVNAVRYSLPAGVPLSYLPMLSKVPTLLMGTPEEVAAVFAHDAKGNETAVARRINTKGSDWAHRSYFDQMIEWLLPQFDNEDIESQPHFIADIGAGYAGFQRRAFEAILTRTKRGELMRRFPNNPGYSLPMIAGDFNPETFPYVNQTLSETIPYQDPDTGETKQFHIPHHVIEADISKPKEAAARITALGLDPEKGLYTSSVLVHNRPLMPLRGRVSWWELDDSAYTTSDNAYAAVGFRISGRTVERNLVDFLREWKPYMKRHGMIIDELHTSPTRITSVARGLFAGTSYDATHGYSGQFLVNVKTFYRKVIEAGLTVRNVVYKPETAPIPEGYAPIAIWHLIAEDEPKTISERWMRAWRTFYGGAKLALANEGFSFSARESSKHERIRSDDSSVHAPYHTGATRLTDHRYLIYAEYGDPNGKPVIYFAGSQGSLYEPIAYSLDQLRGVRLIVMERPGIGESSPHAGYTPNDFAQDVLELVNERLGSTAQFRILGYSAGCPYASVFAANPAVSERLLGMSLVNPPGEMDTTGKLAEYSEEMRYRYGLGYRWRTQPESRDESRNLRTFVMRWMSDIQTTWEQNYERFVNRQPKSDQIILRRPEVVRAMRQSWQATFKHGPDGWMDDIAALTNPWLSSLSMINVPVQVWRGEFDHLRMYSAATEIAQSLRQGQLYTVAGQAHRFIIDKFPEIIEKLIATSEPNAPPHHRGKGFGPFPAKSA